MAAAQDALEAVFAPPDAGSSSWHQPFIEWPANHKQHRIIEVLVELPVDEAFDSLFGPQAPVAEAARQHDGIADHRETAWLPSEAEAAKALRLLAHVLPGAPQPVAEAAAVPSGGYAGRVRMNMTSSRNFGKQVFSFERERCLEATLDGAYSLEICVRSTALMGERFRCVFLHRLTAVDSRTTNWTVDFCLVFVEHVNFLLRKSIETAAHSTVKSNFASMARLLREYAADRAAARAKAGSNGAGPTVFVAA